MSDHDKWCVDTYVSIDMNFNRSKGPFENLQIKFVKKTTSQYMYPLMIKAEVPAPRLFFFHNQLIRAAHQLSMKFILLINVKMPTIVGILTFIRKINTTAERLKASIFFYLSIF